MILKNIFTKRKYEKRNFWDLVYEWENIISKELNVSLVYEPKAFDRVLKGVPGLYFMQTGGKLSLCFQMGAEVVPDRVRPLQEMFGLRAKNIKSVIPCIIDFWQPESDIKAMERAYSHNRIVLVTSREAVNFLDIHEVKMNYIHWPLSLPDQYGITPETWFEKRYDIALMGRECKLFQGFLERYISEHPDIVYTVKKRENGHFNYYTNKGEFIGCADTREGYFDIMRGGVAGCIQLQDWMIRMVLMVTIR